MVILVLGSTGFIGRNLIEELERSTTFEIHGCSRSTGIDLRDYNQVSDKIKEVAPDVIYNVASHGGSLHYVKEYAADVFNDNVQMALNIYRAVKEHSPKTKIIQPFSNCSYPGDSSIQEEKNWLSGEVHDSIFSFGNSKRSLYYLSSCYLTQCGISSVNILFPNTYGPGDSCDPNHTHALNGMIIRMIEAKKRGDKEFVVWGTGSPVREWAYVDDFIDILIYAIDIDVQEWPINFGQEKGYSIAESAMMIKEAVGFDGDITFDTSKTDGDPVKILSTKEFKKSFPKFEFYNHQLGIQNTVKYYEDKLLS
jgi:GDP-L-fucose synthase